MKMLTIVLVALIAIGGTVIGLGYAGVMKIPGITPDKKKSTVATQGTATKSEAEETTGNNKSTEQPPTAEPPTKPVEPPVSEPPPTTSAPKKDGTERVASLWSNMDTAAVKKILLKWEDGDALPVLAKMEDVKLAELLAAIAADDPEKAARISKGIKALEKGGK
ncbi:MAG: hypothetical protein U0R49_08685 [Fimbriimonadales bacterium]